MGTNPSAFIPNKSTNHFNEVVEALANIKKMSSTDESSANSIISATFEYIRKPLKISTPKEKVKKRPDGFDYVESAWMDQSFKTFSPLYDTSLVLHNESEGWIDVIVSVTDKITRNTELGAGSAKIQVSNNTGSILDKGNNLTSALTKAIKNAQSRFGHASDIYKKRQEVPSDDEKDRFKSMLIHIKQLNPSRANIFAEQWDQLGTDFTEYLDYWQVYIDKNIQKAESSDSGSNVIDL